MRRVAYLGDYGGRPVTPATTATAVPDVIGTSAYRSTVLCGLTVPLGPWMSFKVVPLAAMAARACVRGLTTAFESAQVADGGFVPT
jgi:hypothetical protein